MKLCYFYTDITLKGGIERVLSLLISEQIKDQKLEITLVSQYKTFDAPHYKFPANLKICYLSDSPYDGKPASFHRLWLQLRNLKNVRSFFKSNSFDIIVSQAFPNAFTLYLSGVDTQKVVSEEQVFYGYYNKWVRGLRTLIYRKLRAIVVLTEKDRQSFLRHISNVWTIPNPVVLSERHHAVLQNKKIISVGRLEYQKGYDTLISAFNNVHKLFPEWILEIYGEGTLKESLQKQIDENGLTEVFLLKGTTDKVYERMRDASFFVMSSRFEGFGMVLVEAMSQGVPCVSFDCPNGPSDIITDGKDGLLVENQNEMALAKSIERLIQNESLRKQLGHNAYSKVTIFSIDRVIGMWNELYEKNVLRQ